jgi:hypothetical protein
MPKPTKGQNKAEYVQMFMSSPEAKKSFPDEKKRLAVAYSMWEKKHGGKKPVMSGMGGIELKASICPSEVDEATVKQYGYELKDIDQNGYHLIEFDLMLLDEPCNPVVSGELEGQVRTFIFPSMYADSMLASL